MDSKSNIVANSNIVELKGLSKLYILLNKFLHKYYDKNELTELLNRKLTDNEYFKIFAEKMPKIDMDISKINYDRGRKRLKEINMLLKKTNIIIKTSVQNNLSTQDFRLFSDENIKPITPKYIDIGCDDGIITSVVGQGLGFKTNDIICCDVKSEVDNSLIYIKSDGRNINVLSNTVSFATLFQTIHHMKYIEDMLAEISRITIPGAIVIIREHDVGFERFRESNIKLFKLEHQMYDIVMDHMSIEEFDKKYHATYFSCNELKNLMAKYNFTCLYTEYINKYNPTNYYYAIYQNTKKIIN